MRENESKPRGDAQPLAVEDGGPPVLAIIGAGRVGGALARVARLAGITVRVGGRDDALAACEGATAVLICVPDSEIETACQTIAAGRRPEFVGHVSGATGLGALATVKSAGAETFVLHPLQTIPDPEAELAGTPCAISGASERALTLATGLADRLGLRPFELEDRDRIAYHAAACMASNFLVALEESAAGLLEQVGIEDGRELLAPLVLRTAANWAERGSEALTGPIARGDEATVQAHLEELSRRSPELVEVYRALATRTRALGGTSTGRPVREDRDDATDPIAEAVSS